MSAVINFFDSADKSFSKQISNMKTGAVMEYTLWVPFHIFKIYGYPFLILLVMYIYPLVEQELKKIESINELEIDERLDYEPFFILFHFAVCFVVIRMAAIGL